MILVIRITRTQGSDTTDPVGVFTSVGRAVEQIQHRPDFVTGRGVYRYCEVQPDQSVCEFDTVWHWL